MAYGGQLPESMRPGRQKRYRADVPDLDPHDAGFIRGFSLPDFAASAQREAFRAAQRKQPQRQRLAPSEDQTAAAAGTTQRSRPAAVRGLEGVLADDSDDDEVLTAAAVGDETGAGHLAAAAAAATLSDTVAALRLLHAQFPPAGRAAGLPPIMLKSQLYTIVKDRTIVDRELDDLRRKGTVRVFKLASGTADVYAYMLSDDYKAVVGRQRAALVGKGTPAGQLAALDWFLASVVPECPEVAVPHRQLLSLLAQPLPTQLAQQASPATAQAPQPDADLPAEPASIVHQIRPLRRRKKPGDPGGSGQSSAPAGLAAPQEAGSVAVTTGGGTSGKRHRSAAGGGSTSNGNAGQVSGSNAVPHKVTEAHVSLLLNAGLLARHASDRGLYLFGVPDTGPLVKSMAKGREELLGVVSRRKYSEMFERDWEGRKLQRSLLDTHFHIRDLVGSGALERIQTTAGPLLRAVKRG